MGATRRLSLGSTVILVLAALLMVPSEAVESDCRQYTVIGSRGSGEDLSANEGLGSPNAAFANKLRELVGTENVAVLPNQYAAVPVAGWPSDWINGAGAGLVADFGWGDYHNSVDEGSEWLAQAIRDLRSECVSTRIILAGYSQGAEATGNAYSNLFDDSDRASIHGIVLFGDPLFNPESFASRGNALASQGGLLGTRAEFPEIGRGRILSYCHAGDMICQGAAVRGWDTINFNGLAQHTNYDVEGDYPREAARYFVGIEAQLPVPVGPPMDLVFVLDSTGSMASSFLDIKNQIAGILHAAEGISTDVRVGLVQYKDTNQGDDYSARVTIDFTSDTGAFETQLLGITAEGGGDTPEGQLSGQMAAIGMDWRLGVRKNTVHMTDAPGKDPEPVTGYTRDQVSESAFEIDPVVLNSIVVGGSSQASAFQDPLTTASGGRNLTASSGSETAEKIIEAIQSTGSSPFAFITPPGTIPAGVSWPLSAGDSMDPLGRPLSFTWDLDGDGAYESLSDGPVTSATFGVGTHLIGLRVETPSGDFAYGSSLITAVDPGEFTATPEAPTNVQVVPGEASTGVTWSESPTGAPTEAYVVTTANQEFLGFVANGGDASVEIPNDALPLDVVITAVNRVGEGASTNVVHVAAPPYAGPPVVGVITPCYGSPSGGTSVTILGQGLTQDSSVYFGDKRSSNVTFHSFNGLDYLIAVSPPKPKTASSKVPLTVKNQVGTSSPVWFYYLTSPPPDC